MKHFIPHECGSYLQKKHIYVFSGDRDHIHSVERTSSPFLGWGPQEGKSLHHETNVSGRCDACIAKDEKGSKVLTDILVLGYSKA